MILSQPEIHQVRGQTGAEVLPPNQPLFEELEVKFGSHTFFVDENGLYVWDRPRDGKSNPGKLVGTRLAIWTEKENRLIPGEPVCTREIHLHMH